MKRAAAYRAGADAYTTLGVAAAKVYATYPDVRNATVAVSVTLPDNRLTPYLGDLAEGGVVIDKRSVTSADFWLWLYGGPALRETLPPGTHYQLFTGAEKLTDPRRASGWISLDLYLVLWRSLGARIGVRRGNTIVWETGPVQEIPPVDRREDCTIEEELALLLRLPLSAQATVADLAGLTERAQSAEADAT